MMLRMRPTVLGGDAPTTQQEKAELLAGWAAWPLRSRGEVGAWFEGMRWGGENGEDEVEARVVSGASAVRAGAARKRSLGEVEEEEEEDGRRRRRSQRAARTSREDVYEIEEQAQAQVQVQAQAQLQAQGRSQPRPGEVVTRYGEAGGPGAGGPRGLYNNGGEAGSITAGPGAGVGLGRGPGNGSQAARASDFALANRKMYF